MGYPVVNIKQYADEIYRQSYERPTGWSLIIIANCMSGGRTVELVLDNFNLLDLVSDEINFFLPGYNINPEAVYPNSQNRYREPEQRMNADDIRREIARLSDEALFSFIQSITLRGVQSLSIEEERRRVDELEQICERRAYETKRDIPDYYGGNPIRIVKSRRLGDVVFNDADFADFILELTRNGKYQYTGNCDLVIIPVADRKPFYSGLRQYNLDKIVDSPHGLSVDAFLFHVFDILRRESVTMPEHSIAESMSRDKLRIELKNNIDELSHIARRNHLSDTSLLEWCETARQIARPSIFGFFNNNQTYLIEWYMQSLLFLQTSRIWNDIDRLYEESVRFVDLNDNYQIVIRVQHEVLSWLRCREHDEFYFISYSSNDALKAKGMKKLLEERDKKVWIAPDGIPQGRDYSLIVPTALKMAKNFVLMLSHSSAQSKWVKRELDIAINQGISTSIKVVLVDGYSIADIQNDNELQFYLNKIQVKYTFEELQLKDEKMEEFVF